MSVDLPEPDGPMIAVNCPRSSSTLIPRNATTWASPDPYTFHTSVARAATPATAAVVVTVPPKFFWTGQATAWPALPIVVAEAPGHVSPWM
jgi:hypothetical protein